MSGTAPIGAISPSELGAVVPDDLVPTPGASPLHGPGAASDFGALVEKGISELNRQLLASQTGLQQLATGDVQNLHQVMIQLEESRLSLQLAMQVRNRLLEAYQDVMKMQV